MIYNALGWFTIISAIIILACIFIYSMDRYKPYQLVLWIVVSEIVLALIIVGACLLELGGGTL